MTTQEIATIEESTDLIAGVATGSSALNDFKRAREIASVIVSELEPLGVFVEIGRGKEKQRHLTIRGWQMIGSWLNITSQIEATTRLEDADGVFWGYQAIGVATRNGVVVGRSSARCLVEERNWKGKPEFTLESMAETRAQSKALRSVCGPIVWMANTIEGRISDVPISDSPAEINIGRDGINEGGRMSMPAVEDSDYPPGALAEFAEKELGLNHPVMQDEKKAAPKKAGRQIEGTGDLDPAPLPDSFSCPRAGYCTSPDHKYGVSLRQREGKDVKGGDNYGQDVIQCRNRLEDNSWCNKEWPRNAWLQAARGTD